MSDTDRYQIEGDHEGLHASEYYLPAGTPCQWCQAPLLTDSERNASVCDACFQALDKRHEAREAAIRAQS